MEGTQNETAGIPIGPGTLKKGSRSVKPGKKPSKFISHLMMLNHQRDFFSDRGVRWKSTVDSCGKRAVRLSRHVSSVQNPSTGRRSLYEQSQFCLDRGQLGEGSGPFQFQQRNHGQVRYRCESILSKRGERADEGNLVHHDPDLGSTCRGMLPVSEEGKGCPSRRKTEAGEMD